MITVTLPDGATREYQEPVTGLAIAESISKGLAKKAVAVEVAGELRDLSAHIAEDCQVRILTEKDREALDILRHSASHVLAQAVKHLYPDARLGIGPAIEEGFYYDFLMDPVDEEDLEKIEAEMNRIVKEKLEVARQELSFEEAKQFFAQEPFKLELIEDIAGEGENITLYRQGDFADLCRGPHVPDTGRVTAFKLLRSSGAYWRGDADNAQLQRIYGTAFFDKKELKAYLKLLEEREKRDHNRVGRQLEYFTTVPEVGQGLPLLMPKGAKLKQVLQRFVEEEEERRGYQFTITPFMAKSDLYEISGHWEHYRDGMFVLDASGETAALRPMTCPFQFMIYKNKRRSYRELPIRYAETSTLFRNEASGEMHGLIRVRQFTLSDGHIICRPDQLKEEFFGVLDLVGHVMKTVGIEGIWYRFSKWDPAKKEKYIDNPEAWEMSQQVLKECLDEAGVEYTEADGEAAFYGPKLDIQVRNVYGKEDTIITVQFDFALPERFDLTYVAEDGSLQRPMVIHRSSIGCYERTMAFLIEQFAGKLPYWMSPEQVVVMTITDQVKDYAAELVQKLKDAGVRAKLDGRQEKINRKVRDAQTEYIPVMVTIGEKEQEQGTVALRNLAGELKFGVGADDFVAYCTQMNKDHTLWVDFSAFEE